MTDERPHISIYTDGGCDPNPGPGGWAAILIHPKKTRELSGGYADSTTNNRMELTAAIEALKALKMPCEIEFHTDSEYLRKGITEWMAIWLQKGKFEKGKVKNADLWLELFELTQAHEIHWHWVKGHAGDPYNERADQLAMAAIPRPAQVKDESRTQVYFRISGTGNPGAYGWVAQIVRGDQGEVLSGGHRSITSNHAVLAGVIDILQQLPPDEPLQFFTNNSYLYDGITKWVNGWRNSGWQKPDKFREDWQTLDRLNQERSILWTSFKDTVEPEEFVGLADAVKDARQQAEKR